MTAIVLILACLAVAVVVKRRGSQHCDNMAEYGGGWSVIGALGDVVLTFVFAAVVALGIGAVVYIAAGMVQAAP